MNKLQSIQEYECKKILNDIKKLDIVKQYYNLIMLHTFLKRDMPNSSLNLIISAKIFNLKHKI